MNGGPGFLIGKVFECTLEINCARIIRRDLARAPALVSPVRTDMKMQNLRCYENAKILCKQLPLYETTKHITVTLKTLSRNGRTMLGN